MFSIKKNIRDNYRKIIFRNERKKLDNLDFTIISNNCWGGNVYRDLDIPYNSPFVGMFIYSDDYLRLCENLEVFLKEDLIIVKKSKHQKKMKDFQLQFLGILE